MAKGGPLGADEKELVVACVAGEEDARERLYARHAGCVMAYLLRSGFVRSDADDLLQETFLNAFRSLGTFDPQRGSFRAWVGAIARNVARRQWARRREAERYAPELAEEMLPGDSESADAPQANEEMELLRAGIRSLPGELRRVLELRYVESLTTRSIAKATDLPESTVRLRLEEAYELLQARLRKAGVQE